MRASVDEVILLLEVQQSSYTTADGGEHQELQLLSDTEVINIPEGDKVFEHVILEMTPFHSLPGLPHRAVVHLVVKVLFRRQKGSIVNANLGDTNGDEVPCVIFGKVHPLLVEDAVVQLQFATVSNTKYHNVVVDSSTRVLAMAATPNSQRISGS